MTRMKKILSKYKSKVVKVVKSSKIVRALFGEVRRTYKVQ